MEGFAKAFFISTSWRGYKVMLFVWRGAIAVYRFGITEIVVSWNHKARTANFCSWFRILTRYEVWSVVIFSWRGSRSNQAAILKSITFWAVDWSMICCKGLIIV